MSNTRRDHGPLVVGGEPRIDFLPPETKKRKENRRRRRSLIALIIMVGVACVVGIYFAAAVAVQSQIVLDAEIARTQDLLEQQKEFADARTAANELKTAQDARIVGSAPEVLWYPNFLEVLKVLPEGVVVTNLAIDSQSATDLNPVGTVPLRNPRVATMFLGIEAPSLAVADSVLKNLKKVPAYADATATTVEWEEDRGVYTMSVTLNITSEALARRYFKNPLPEDSTVDESTETEG